MQTNVSLEKIYIPSENIVAREVHGEFIIIPITSGVGDLEGDIFTLNETGRAIWQRLDAKTRLKDVIKDLKVDFEGPLEEIRNDVIGITEELLKRKMLIEVKREK